METKKIYECLSAIMSETDAIGKDRKNQQQGYNFRGIDDIYNALHASFAKHGVFITNEILSATREERQTKNGGLLIYSIIDFRFTFHASDGSYVTTDQRGEAMDSADKASNKAASAALKYALMQILLIPTIEEKDPDASSPDPAAKKPEQPKTTTTKPATFTDAIKEEIQNAKVHTELKTIFDKYPALRENKDFKDALTTKKLELT